MPPGSQLVRSLELFGHACGCDGPGSSSSGSLQVLIVVCITFFHSQGLPTKPRCVDALDSPGRVPNSPAKSSSASPDLDVICWMPHCRSWRVEAPRVRREIRVIPIEHAKFSLSGLPWLGIPSCYSRMPNLYYHELFMRGLPHLWLGALVLPRSRLLDPEHELDFTRSPTKWENSEKAGRRSDPFNGSYY
jgi:hypothetical protein